MTEDFDRLDQKWFDTYAEKGSANALRLWGEWRKGNPNPKPETAYRKVLELTSGLSAGAIGHYLNGRTTKLGSHTLDKLDQVSEALGVRPPERDELGKGVASGGGTSSGTIVLLTELWNLPSTSYHFATIRGILRAASPKYHVFIHEVSRETLDTDVSNIAGSYVPDGVIMLRLTPGRKALSRLARRKIPVVLVHGDRQAYPAPPVLTHVVPDQGPIRQLLPGALEVLMRARRSPRREGKLKAVREGKLKAVLVRKELETPVLEFPRLEGIEPSIRNERICLIAESVERVLGTKPIKFEVADYSSSQAIRVHRAHPDADVFVCLSDEIAVGLRHLLEVAGTFDEKVVIGFDNSQLAHQHGIPSFGQALEVIGDTAVKRLHRWLVREEPPAAWPEFGETALLVDFSLRDYRAPASAAEL